MSLISLKGSSCSAIAHTIGFSNMFRALFITAEQARQQQVSPLADPQSLCLSLVTSRSGGVMVGRVGAGPRAIPYKQLTADGLANAIREALRPETLERAKALGERIREEKGCEAGSKNFQAQMDVNRLRCMMAPSRAAVWRVKTKQSKTDDIRLSAFAATVLGNEGLLNVN